MGVKKGINQVLETVPGALHIVAVLMVVVVTPVISLGQSDRINLSHNSDRINIVNSPDRNGGRYRLQQFFHSGGDPRLGRRVVTADRSRR